MEEGYYIQDVRRYIGNSVVWWAVGGHGYTTDLKKAWRVSKEKAISITSCRSTDVVWPRDFIDAGVELHFDADNLRGNISLSGRRLHDAESA